MNILLLNQCFYPDVVSTAQHASDLAVALVQRGHAVTVIASDRGYDNTQLRYARREDWQDVRILRVPCIANDKRKRWTRALNFASFMLTCLWRTVWLPRFDVVIALTSPPLISVIASLAVRAKGGRFIFWVMDLNPDEAVAAGWLQANSRVTRLLERLLRFSTDTADSIVALDRFMTERLQHKGVTATKLVVIPPWSHDQQVHYDQNGRRAFRRLHNLEDRYVVMYSGNHSPCHPLDTVLEAALRLASRPDIVFCFVGGGSEHGKVREFAHRHQLGNIICLPYQPLDALAGSLSAADLHLVVLGNPFVGIVHPCKIYNLLTVGVPVLFIGPAASHVTDIAAGRDLPIARVEHGDVTGIIERIQTGAVTGFPDERMRAASANFSAEFGIGAFAAVVENRQGLRSDAVVCKAMGDS